MVMLKSWQEVLENAFNILNKVYYNNELPPFQSDERPQRDVYGL